GRVGNLLDTVDVAGEARHHHQALGVSDDVPKDGPNGALAARGAGVLRVGRVGQEQMDAAPRFLGDPLEVGEPTVDRCAVKLEVSRVQEDAGREIDGDRAAVGD